MNTKQQLLEEFYNQHRNNPDSPLIIDKNTNLVFGEGNLDATLMFVGEAPGKEEDIQKRPFVGRAGQLLNRTLQDCGLKREDVYITNIIKARPTNNRTPTPKEINRCWPILEQQIAIIKPKVICSLGACALLAFVKKPTSITRQHGFAVPFEHFTLVPTFHPAFILRSADFYPKFTSDIKFIAELVKKF